MTNTKRTQFIMLAVIATLAVVVKATFLLWIPFLVMCYEVATGKFYTSVVAEKILDKLEITK